MKSKRASKSRKRTRPKKSVGARTRSNTRESPRSSATPIPSPPVPSPPANVDDCEEVEVGDIGGFGDTEELEAHEKRCGQRATEFCHTCTRRLCNSHYELLHRDHDTISGHNIGRGLTLQ